MTRKDILISLAQWTPITANTEVPRTSFAVRLTDTAEDMKQQAAEAALAVISAQVLCVWTAFAAVWVAVDEKRQ